MQETVIDLIRHGQPEGGRRYRGHAIDDPLSEVGFGHWEGQSPQQIQKNKRAEYEAFYRDPVNCRPEGAESLDCFIPRVTQAYQQIIQHQVGKHCLVVTHAGVIRAIVTYILQAPLVAMYRMQVSHAGVTRIRHNKYGAQLEFHNGSFA